MFILRFITNKGLGGGGGGAKNERGGMGGGGGGETEKRKMKQGKQEWLTKVTSY